MNQEIETLKANTAFLKPGDVVFANSLIDFYNKKKNLSDKQMYWVGVLNQRATPTVEHTKEEVINVGSFDQVQALFDEVANRLKKPKIRFMLPGEGKIVLTRNVHGKYPGTIDISDGGPYGASTWYGRVHTDGTWNQSARAKEVHTSLYALLCAIASNPVNMAVEYGKITGCCSFCEKPLTDRRSLFWGYGPICSKKWGLPWAL